MSTPGEWFRRARYLLNRRREEEALRREMEAHREMMAAPARFGNTLRLREQAQDVWGWHWLDALVRDVRFAVRGLHRTPVFTLVAISSLAIGFALATTIVSVVNAYLIRSVPYPGADRLYHVRYAPPGPWEPRGMSGLDWTSTRDVVEFPIASAGESFYLTGQGPASVLRGLRATRGFVEGLGISVVEGRRFTEQDFVEASERVALLGHSVWRDRFGSDPAAIGRLIRVEAESGPGAVETFRIVGILPPAFYFGRASRTGVDLLVPQTSPVRAYMVRLRPGVPPAAAEQRLTEVARQAATSPLPADWSGVQLESVHERWVGELRPVLFGVTLAVSLVLVIVCANLAVLVLLRSMQRQKEVAVRLALGSGWTHIARMLVTETVLICAVSLGAGIAVTALLLRTLAPLIETQLGRPAPSASGIVIDATVLLIVGGISLVILVALSMAPLASWGRALTNALQQDGRVASEGRSMRRLRGGLIACEIAGSLVLLVGCGLMIRSLATMMNTDLGFVPEGLTRSRVMLQARHYPDPAAYRRFHAGFADRASATTRSKVVFSSWPPFVPPPTHLIEPDAGSTAVSAGAIAVSAGYFSAFGIPMRQGREFTAEEASVGAPVAIISEALGRRLWPDGTALGRRVREVEQTPAGSTHGPWRTIVGIAGDVRQTYDDTDREDFYSLKTPDGRFGMFYIRTHRPAQPLFEDLQRAAVELDPAAVVSPPRLVAGEDQTLAGTRFLTFLLTGFAAIAASLAVLGIYGVTAYAVQQRRKEVAIRVALGASGRAVAGMFLREGAWVLGVGSVMGLIGGATLSRMLRYHVFGVQSFDVPTYAIAWALVAAAGFAAVFWAARRAALGDPVAALNAS